MLITPARAADCSCALGRRHGDKYSTYKTSLKADKEVEGGKQHLVSQF